MIENGCETFVSDCQVRTAVELINHTWDPIVLTALRAGPTRRVTLLRRIAGVSDKVLTESLRRLASRGLVSKTTLETGRDAVVYELSDLGASLAHGPLLALAQWAADHQPELAATA